MKIFIKFFFVVHPKSIEDFAGASWKTNDPLHKSTVRLYAGKIVVPFRKSVGETILSRSKRNQKAEEVQSHTRMGDC